MKNFFHCGGSAVCWVLVSVLFYSGSVATGTSDSCQCHTVVSDQRLAVKGQAHFSFFFFCLRKHLISLTSVRFIVLFVYCVCFYLLCFVCLVFYLTGMLHESEKAESHHFEKQIKNIIMSDITKNCFK